MKVFFYILSFVIISFLSTPLFAQKASNADFYEKDKKIYITYSLDKEADITLTISIDGGQFQRISSSNLSGDIGMNVKPGKKKQIVWDVLKDKDKLIGEVKFQVISGESFNSYKKRAKQQNKSSISNKTSSYSYTCNSFYNTASVADLVLIELGFGAILKSSFSLPMYLSTITFRYKMFELAPADFTWDIMSLANNKNKGFYWSPQVRVVIPINSKMAFVPSVGPTLDLQNREWWFLLKANIRYYELSLAGSYLDFFLGYENKGFAIGVSISYSLPILKK